MRLLRNTRYFFFAVAILALGYTAYVLADATLFQAYQNWQFERDLASAKSAPAAIPASLPPAETEAIPTPAARLARPVVEDVPLGRIEISAVGLEAMIMEGVASKTLRRAVGHVPGTALPGQTGNVAIAGHRDTFFRGLQRIQNGHEITLTTLSGVTRYLVESTQVVEPSDMKVLASSDDAILTLVTCYPFDLVGPAPKRFIVRAQKVPPGLRPPQSTQ